MKKRVIENGTSLKNTEEKYGDETKDMAVLLLLVLSVSCVACDMGEAVESGSSNAVVSEELVVEEKAEERVEATSTPTPTIAPTIADVMVWLPATGEKYHNKNNCGKMNPDKARQVTKSEAERRGYEPCGKCY